MVDEKTEVVEQATVETPATEVAKPDGLSNRDALEKAMGEKRELRPGQERDEPDAPAVKDAPTDKQVKAAVDSDMEPPQEFSKEAKEAWKNGDYKRVIKEYDNLAKERLKALSRADSERDRAVQEAKPYKELAAKMSPYIKARGDEGVTAEVAIMEAMALVEGFKKGDKASIKAELKKLGHDFDASDDGQPAPKVDESKLDTLQKSVEALLEDKRRVEIDSAARAFDSVFNEMAALKNRTGESVFPDITNSEAGMDLAQRIGSRVKDREFQAMVLRRFPDAKFPQLVQKAYEWEGGRISGEPNRVSPEEKQKHVERSRRAAASTPGRVVVRDSSTNLVGKLSGRAALAKALDESREH